MMKAAPKQMQLAARDLNTQKYRLEAECSELRDVLGKLLAMEPLHEEVQQLRRLYLRATNQIQKLDRFLKELDMIAAIYQEREKDLLLQASCRLRLTPETFRFFYLQSAAFDDIKLI